MLNHRRHSAPVFGNFRGVRGANIWRGKAPTTLRSAGALGIWLCCSNCSISPPESLLVNRRTWQSIRLVAGVLITLICLHWALSGIRVVGLVEAATQAQWRWLVVAAISLALGYFMRICRWWCMLRLYNHRIALRTCAWPLIVGVGVNNIVPFRAGDAVRILAFREQLGTPVAHILGSVI